MESMWLLIPLSALLVLALIALFGWALNKGQFDDLEAEGERILTDDTPPVDANQSGTRDRSQESAPRSELFK